MKKRWFTVVGALLVSMMALVVMLCLLGSDRAGASGAAQAAPLALQPTVTEVDPSSAPNDLDTPIVISGTGLGLPGAEKPVMDPDNAMRILQGEQFIDLIPERFRKSMANKRITRLVFLRPRSCQCHFVVLPQSSCCINQAPMALRDGYMAMAAESHSSSTSPSIRRSTLAVKRVARAAASRRAVRRHLPPGALDQAN